MSSAVIDGPRVLSAIAELFADLSEHATRVNLKAGEAVYENGTPAHSLYLIQKGQVRLYQQGSDDSSRLVEILGPSQWFGSGALSNAQLTATRAVAVTATQLLVVPAERVMDELRSRPDAAIEIITYLASSLQNAREDAARLVFDDCNERLIKTLLRFSQSAAATEANGGVVLHITHDQLAQAVGVARETVSLALTQLRLQNLLRTGRNQLSFNPERLREFHTNRVASKQVAEAN